jgi:hypothetical protein
MRNANKILVWKPDVKRPLGRPRHRWESNIKMDLTEIGLEGVDGIHLTRNRDRRRALMSMLLNFRGPSKVGNFLIS